MFSFATVVRLIVVAGLSLAAVITQASSLSVSPIVITLGQDSRSAAITVRNNSDEPRVIQTELLRWTQENGENRYAPSSDILVNPPIATLQPRQSQIIRVGLTGKGSGAEEQAYRLYVSEVPMPAKPGFSGVRIALRIGLGVFVMPTATARARPEWKAARDADGSLQLNLRNAGNRHLRLTSLLVIDPVSGKQLSAPQRRPITLLAGQARHLVLPLPAEWRGTQLRLLSDMEGEQLDSTVHLNQPGQ